MNYLLLGGAGFIGSHLAHALVRAGHQVTVFDNKRRETGKPLPGGCLFIVGDVRALGEASPDLFSQHFDWVVNLAGIVGVPNVERHPLETFEVAQAATLLMLAIDADAYFVASTSELYGGACPITSEDAPVVIPDLQHIRSVYAVGKAWMETAVITSGRPYVIGRFHNIYGPYSGADHVIPQFCLRLREGDNPVLVDDPLAVRAFCYITDAVEAIRAAMQLENAIVNIGNPEEPVTMRRLIEHLQAVAGTEYAIKTGTLHGYPRVRIPSIDRLAQATGWRPRIPLAVGLRATWEAYGRRSEEGR